MELFIKKLAELINVKTIVTFAVMYIFVRLAVGGQIDAQASMQIVTMVIAFYFGTQYDKSGTKGGKHSSIENAPAQVVVTPATKKQSHPDTKKEAER